MPSIDVDDDAAEVLPPQHAASPAPEFAQGPGGAFHPHPNPPLISLGAENGSAAPLLSPSPIRLPDVSLCEGILGHALRPGGTTRHGLSGIQSLEVGWDTGTSQGAGGGSASGTGCCPPCRL